VARANAEAGRSQMGKERCLRALIPLVVSLAASVTTTAAASADSEPMGTVRHAINEDKVGWKNWLAQHFKPPQKGQQAPQNQVSQNHCDGYGRQPSRAVNLRMMKETDIQRIKTSEIQKDKFVVTFPSLYYQWYINRFGKYCWVAEEASTSRMVGYMLGKSEGIPLRGHVSAIAVHPDFRGQGIARRMMKMLEHAADREKCQFVLKTQHHRLGVNSCYLRSTSSLILEIQTPSRCMSILATEFTGRLKTIIKTGIPHWTCTRPCQRTRLVRVRKGEMTRTSDS